MQRPLVVEQATFCFTSWASNPRNFFFSAAKVFDLFLVTCDEVLRLRFHTQSPALVDLCFSSYFFFMAPCRPRTVLLSGFPQTFLLTHSLPNSSHLFYGVPSPPNFLLGDPKPRGHGSPWIVPYRSVMNLTFLISMRCFYPFF